MYHYRQVLARMRQNDSDRDIAKSKIMGRKKLAEVRAIAGERGWLRPEIPLPDDATLAEVFAAKAELPASCQSTAAPWRDEIAKWHASGIVGTRIHQVLVERHGYTGSYSLIYRMLRQIEADRDPDVPMRLEFAPGEAEQVDFGAGSLITDVQTGEVFKTWFFVMTLCSSRHQYVEIVLDQTVATWLSCHRHAFEWFGGVPGRIIIDNPKCAIIRASIHEPEVQRSYAECAEGYGFKIDPCPPRDPQKKGIVESGVKYVKRSFLPLREFRSLADANRQVQAWVMETAGNRCHGTTREAPLARFAETERGMLKRLPDVPPELAIWAKVKVHRDAHAEFQKCLYSAPFRLVGQELWLKATDTTVKLYREHELVAAHARQPHPGSRSTVTDHLSPEAQAWQMQGVEWCLREAERIGPSCHALVRAMFGDTVLVKLRAVQSVLRLEKTYGAIRLEAACRRANHFGTPTSRAVKTILQKGLDLQTDHSAFDVLSATYTQGGRFCRDTETLLVH